MKFPLQNIVNLLIIVTFAVSPAISSRARVKLPALVSDGMVLQRGQPVTVWGTADAGERVVVKFLKKSYTATADEEGKWEVILPAMKAGGPYILTVNDIEVKNILIGDVWLCSGQSNMELPVSRVTDMFADEIESYENDKIRHIIVPKEYNFHAPQTEMSPAKWAPLTKENVMSFSALAYFFAKDMYARTGVPVGIINASWGGTRIESWISEDGLRDFPLYINDKRRYEDDAYCRHIKEVEGENYRQWNGALWAGDAGLHEPTPWYAEDYDDSLWPEVDMFSTEWGNDGLNPTGGSHWLRKDVIIPESWEGKEAVLRMGCIVDADSVYVNGTFVGTTGYQYPPRIYKIPAGVLKEGKNNVTVRIISNGGQPSFVKEKPYKIICQTTEGKQEVSLEGSWKYHPGAPMQNAPDMMFFCYKPTCLYNAMIAPLRSYVTRGVVWYQGESNVDRRNEYALLLKALMADWRRTFGDESLPFYIIELADFLPKEDTQGRKAWAELRKQQALAAEETDGAYLVKNSDLGEWNDIHPLDKKTLAGRIAEMIDNN